MAGIHEKPELRPVQVLPSASHRGGYDLTDPSGLMSGVMTLSPTVMSILSMMDGRHRRVDIQAEFMRRHGSMLFSDDLSRLIEQLDEAFLLAGPRFDAHVAELTEAYRAATVRPVRDRQTLGAPWERLGAYFDELLSKGEDPERRDGAVLGLVAPHLDYERGAPCYADAYRGLADRTDATRFVILGTNHAGHSAPVIATKKDFETPFGTVEHDGAFIDSLSARCGVDLCEHEYDHVREHSIELQVLLLRHVLGNRAFSIVPVLCSGVCEGDGGLSLSAFAAALREQVLADDVPTCLIAGADLSHVGRFFDDDRDLDVDTLHAVEVFDRQILEAVVRLEPDAFEACVQETGNATNVCSVGSLFVLASVLKGEARARLVRYHQAVTPEAENCVTCASLEFVSG